MGWQGSLVRLTLTGSLCFWGHMNTKDCLTCRNRVELHPEFKRRKWSSVPCSHCEYMGEVSRGKGKRISIESVTDAEIYRAITFHDPRAPMV